MSLGYGCSESIKEVINMNAGSIILTIVLVCLVIFILGIWFPVVKKIYSTILWGIAEVLYIVLFWWWYATIQKARGKKYPDPLVWKELQKNKKSKR